MEAKANVWSRAARRKRRFTLEKGNVEELDGASDVAEDGSGDEEAGVVVLAVKITCKKEQVDVRWLRGKDHMLFVSLLIFVVATMVSGQYPRS